MGVGVQRYSAATLPLGLRSLTRCTGGWVGRRAGLDECGKVRPPPGFNSLAVQSVASRGPGPNPENV
jgi:hypothetical protein